MIGRPAPCYLFLTPAGLSAWHSQGVHYRQRGHGTTAPCNRAQAHAAAAADDAHGRHGEQRAVAGAQARPRRPSPFVASGVEEGEGGDVVVVPLPLPSTSTLASRRRRRGTTVHAYARGSSSCRLRRAAPETLACGGVSSGGGCCFAVAAGAIVIGCDEAAGGPGGARPDLEAAGAQGHQTSPRSPPLDHHLHRLQQHRRRRRRRVPGDGVCVQQDGGGGGDRTGAPGRASGRRVGPPQQPCPPGERRVQGYGGAASVPMARLPAGRRRIEEDQWCSGTGCAHVRACATAAECRIRRLPMHREDHVGAR